MDINTFFSILFIISAGVIIIGFLYYKGWELDSWETGVKKVLMFGFDLIYKVYCFAFEELTGKKVSNDVVDYSLMCTNEEVLDLVALLENHPYDTPSLFLYNSDVNGFAEYDISAVGLSASYKDISNEMIAKIAYKLIQNYFMRTRGTQIPLSIRVATSTRLYFAIPLSEQGRKRLEKLAANTMAEPNVVNSEPLEETIDIFEDSAHDSGISKD